MLKIAAGQDTSGKNMYPLLCGIVMDKQLLFAVYTTHYLKEAKELGANLTNFNDKYIRIGIGDFPESLKMFGYSSTFAETYFTEYHYDVAYSREYHNHDSMVMGVAVMKELGDRYIITTHENAIDDVHNFLLAKTTIPIVKEWVPFILDELKNKNKMSLLDSTDAKYTPDEEDRYSFRRKLHKVFCAMPSLEIPLWDKDGSRKFVPMEDIVAYSIDVNDEELRDIVSEGLRHRCIGFEKNKEMPVSLGITEYDAYVNKYSKELEAALDKDVIPLHPTNSELSATAFKKSRLYMPQRSCVNAIARAKEANRKFVIATEEMGCGKTKQAIASVEEYFNSKWLREHPGKSLKDCFNSKEVAYRVVITGPGHIVEKWKDEILSEVPDAKAEVIRDVADFEKIRRKGKQRDGKEFYIISKDALKAGTTISPNPQKVAIATPKMMVCESCYRPKDEGMASKIVPKPSAGNGTVCPKCGGKKWTAINFSAVGDKKKEGLVCPHCSNLLLKPNKAVLTNSADADEILEAVLTPVDFAARTDANSICYHCGEHLWGLDAQTIGSSPRRTKWQKIKHYKNFQKKSTNNVWGYMQSVDKVGDDGVVTKQYPWVNYYLSKVNAPDKWFEEMAYKAGPRKASCSEFVKKHLKGYFDVCILDECHKFEGQGTAQSVAASALVKVSKFVIGLTGTISNGKADSFFWLLWMLMPRAMKKRGYEYNGKGCTRFVEKYGSIQKKFEDESGSRYNKNSRGRQIGQGRIAPGISPLLFVDFLLENCVFLDMSDMSEKLPELKEEVVAVDMPTDVLESYRRDIEHMKKAMKKGCGMTLGGKLLSHSLSYPDFPFNVEPIKNPIEEDSIVCAPEDFSEQYDSEMLPKEEKMVEIISREIGENRRVFVFGSFTRQNSPLQRWKTIIEENCNLKGRVAVLEATTTSTDGREEWIHKQAKAGIQVIICNCKLVETGLDFCFEDGGTYYNYPSIIFMQTTYELSVLWQASHRHYRLNQREECRTFWMAYKGTLQMTALELMAEKIVAVSAIQGKFSSGALSAMARGVDAQLKLAESLKHGAMSSEEEVNSMFEKARSTSSQIEEIDVPMQTYYEVIGKEPETITEITNFFDLLEEIGENVTETETVNIQEKTHATNAEAKASSVDIEEVDFTEDIFEGIFFTKEELHQAKEEFGDSSKSSKSKKRVEGQQSLWDLFGFC